ncbi:aminotransferase class I/II-fold pyridoxal phosphate-dependent enzyme [Candidatus Woesearchaeota archaeon]|nr:aminotransferase class I/II-fold pyridoxal phosphate-dependent enzyme [Candidatus Woesearchaeota archaeon]
MEVIPAARTRNIRYAIRDLVVLAEQLTGDVLWFNIGDPGVYDFPVPAHLVEAVHQAMLAGKNGYAPSLGVKEARDAVRADALRRGFKAVRNVVMSNGASEAIEFALTALVNPGENVLVPCPGYPLYAAVLEKLGCETAPYFLDERNGWQPDLADMERRVNPKTRAVVLINPNNPTGSVCSKKTLKAALDIARRHHLVVLADEIYDRMLYSGEKHVPLASLAEDVPIASFCGLSKNYLAPGWRVGWLILSGAGTAAYDDAVCKLARARLSANYPMQFAVKPALEGPQGHIAETARKLEERARYLERRCKEIPGLSLTPPKAAFYAFPSVQVADDEAFVKELLMKEKALVVHGSGFGQKPGSQHVRIVYLAPIPQLEQLFERMERLLGSTARK